MLVIAEAAQAGGPRGGAAPTSGPTLVVLNKADLAGAGAGGPLAIARRRAAEIGALTAAPTVPLVGLLAALTSVTLDDELVAALRTFVEEPADLTSVDAFVGGDHPVDRAVRARLLERLDRFGIAHAVVALASGRRPPTCPRFFAS